MKKVKGQHEVSDVDMVKLDEVKNLVEVVQFEYLGVKKLKKTTPVNLS